MKHTEDFEFSIRTRMPSRHIFPNAFAMEITSLRAFLTQATQG